MTSNLWANLVFKRSDAVLVKVKDSIFNSFMDLRNTRFSNSTGLSPADILEKALERSSKVLHDEAICKAMVQEKLQHCHSSSSLSGLLDPHPESLLSGLTPLHCHPPRLLPLLVLGRGRNFEGSSPSSQLQGGRRIRSALACLAVLQH